MRTLRRRALGSILVLLCAGGAAADPALEPFTAVYDVLHGSKRIGVSTFVLRAGDAPSYVFESRTEPKGIAKLVAGTITETSEFTLEEAGPRPLQFDAEESRGHSSQSITFDWTANVAHSQRDGVPAQVALKPRALDHSLIQIALMNDLSAGRPLAPYFIVEKNELRTYEYDRVGEETVETPAGSFAAVLVRQRREGSSRELVFWCAPQLGYLPVKLEQRKEGKAQLTMVLRSVQGQ